MENKQIILWKICGGIDMWAVVCVAAYDYTLLGVRLFNDFDKAARFVREEAVATYEKLSQDGENVSVHCNSGYAEVVVNGNVDYFWDTAFGTELVIDNRD